MIRSARRWMLLCLLCLFCASCPCTCCDEPGSTTQSLTFDGEAPAVHVVREATSKENGYNLLFVGAGFHTDVELDTYRAVAYLMAKNLGFDSPLCHYTDRLNFYRVDVRDSGGVVPHASDCACSLDSLPPVEWTLSGGAPVLDGAEVIDAEFGVEYCHSSSSTAGDCRVLWAAADKIEEFAKLGTLDPEQLTIHTVIVIVNIQEAFGGGHHATHYNELGLVLVGVPMENHGSVDAPNWQPKSQAYRLLTHEIGHALMLMDEYDYGIGTTVDFIPDSNVWNPGAPADWTDPIESLPWEPMLGGCTPETMIDCLHTASESLNGGEEASTHCSYITHSTTSERDRSIHAACDTNAVAWEGAFYEEQKYFRYHDDCRMEALAHPYCDVCRWLVHHRSLCGYGPSPDCEVAVDYRPSDTCPP